MIKSKLTKNQKKQFKKQINYLGTKHTMIVEIRYDDECNNGHNTFSITAEIRKPSAKYRVEACGCLHNEIKKYFPEFKHLIKWHLMSSDKLLYYVTNTLYWIEKGNMEYAKETAIWGVTELDKNVDDLGSRVFLNKRIPLVVAEFKKVIASLGFTY